MLWLGFALGSAFFAGITAVLAKVGMKNVNSTLATAIRTVVVLVFSWWMVFLAGSQAEIARLSGRTLFYLVLSGLSTGASWLCYFRALQLGDVNKVAPIDKSSTVLTILLAFLLLGEPVSAPQIVGVLGIGTGTLLMISRKETDAGGKPDGRWLLFACLSALFASLTSIFGKIGVEGVESNLGTAIRTVVVLGFAYNELAEGARPALATQVEDLSRYDVVFLGYPNWNADLPMPLYTFLESVDLSGKTILPFTVHGGSGFSRTISTIQELQPGATVIEDGLSISRNSVAEAQSAVAEWVQGLDL